MQEKITFDQVYHARKAQQLLEELDYMFKKSPNNLIEALSYTNDLVDEIEERYKRQANQ